MMDSIEAQANEVVQPSRNDTWEQAPARIKVIGVGGGGCNCVRRMSERYVPGVRYVMVNTDIKALDPVPEGVQAIHIGRKATHGWGAGGDMER